MNLSNIPVNHWVDLSKINDSSLVVDAGASRGEFVAGIRKQSKCKIIAIEPNRDNAEYLRAKGVEVIEAALVGKGLPKEMTFYTNNKDDAGSVVVYGTNDSPSYPVKTLNFYDLFKLYPKIDILKLDIEGAERHLIDTMTQEDADRIGQICLEFHYTSKGRLLNKLQSLGYDYKEFEQREIYLFR